MIKASIDIGSNSVLLLAGEYKNGVVRELLNESRITGLGENIDRDKRFSESSMVNTYSVLEEYKDLLNNISLSSENTIVTATEASREVTNAKDFFERVKSNLGFNIFLISSEGEAYYTAKGLMNSVTNSQKNEFIIMDIGGASTELIKVVKNPFAIVETISLKMGSVRSTDWIATNQYEKELAINLSHPALKNFQCAEIICVAGTMVSLAGLLLNLKAFLQDAIEGSHFSISELESLEKKLISMTPEAINAEFPFLGKRSQTISGGAQISLALQKALGVEMIVISTYGLRYGTLIAGGIDEQFII